MQNLSHTRWRLFLPFIALLLGFLLLSGLWFFAAQKIKTELSQNEALQFSQLNMRGFPTQLRITLKALSYHFPHHLSQGILRSDEAQIITLIYKPYHHVFSLTGTQFWESASGAKLTLNGQALRGSLHRRDKKPPRLSLDFQNFTSHIETAIGAPFTVKGEQFNFHIRGDNQRNDNKKSDSKKSDSKKSDSKKSNALENYIAVNGLVMDKLYLNNANAHFTTNGASLKDGVALHAIEARFGEAENLIHLRGGGQLGLDEQNYLHGKIDLQISNLTALLSLLAAHNLLSQDEMQILSLTAKLASAASGDADNHLSLPLQFRKGQIWLGAVPLARAPRF